MYTGLFCVYRVMFTNLLPLSLLQITFDVHRSLLYVLCDVQWSPVCVSLKRTQRRQVSFDVHRSLLMYTGLFCVLCDVQWSPVCVSFEHLQVSFDVYRSLFMFTSLFCTCLLTYTGLF